MIDHPQRIFAMLYHPVVFNATQRIPCQPRQPKVNAESSIECGVRRPFRPTPRISLFPATLLCHVVARWESPSHVNANRMYRFTCSRIIDYIPDKSRTSLNLAYKNPLFHRVLCIHAKVIPSEEANERYICVKLIRNTYSGRCHVVAFVENDWTGGRRIDRRRFGRRKFLPRN